MRKHAASAAGLALAVLTAFGMAASDSVSAAEAAAASPQALLAASDAVRNPDRSFGLTVTLTEYRDGRQTDASTLRIYSKAESTGGVVRTLMQYVAPARDAGKLMLENGTELWFYDPASQASIRISPQQRLLGQASNGDVVTVNLAHDYRAETAEPEDVLDGDRELRHCYRLTLRAAVPDATYGRIELWIERGTSRPVKGRFYAASDRLMKTAYYRRFQDELGQQRPTQTVIIDGLTPTWVTVMSYSDYAWRDVPDSWLQRDYLPRFRPE